MNNAVGRKQPLQQPIQCVCVENASNYWISSLVVGFWATRFWRAQSVTFCSCTEGTTVTDLLYNAKTQWADTQWLPKMQWTMITANVQGLFEQVNWFERVLTNGLNLFLNLATLSQNINVQTHALKVNMQTRAYIHAVKITELPTDT